MFIMELEMRFLLEREAAKILLSFAHNHKITESNTDFSFSIMCVVFHKITLVLHTRQGTSSQYQSSYLDLVV